MSGEAITGTFGERLKTLRVSTGLTQAALAGERFSAAYISTLESGRRRPSPEATRFFADRLGVDPWELVSGRPNPWIDLVSQVVNGLDESATDDVVGLLSALNEGGELSSRALARFLLGVALGSKDQQRAEPLLRAAANLQEGSDAPLIERVSTYAALANCLDRSGSSKEALAAYRKLADELCSSVAP